MARPGPMASRIYSRLYARYGDWGQLALILGEDPIPQGSRRECEAASACIPNRNGETRVRGAGERATLAEGKDDGDVDQ